MGTKTSKYYVLPGQTVILGGQDEDNPQAVQTFTEGDEIELTEEQAEGMPHAVGEVTSKKKVTARDKAIDRRRAELEAQLADLDRQAGPRKGSRAGARAAKDDAALEDALASIKNRADNPANGLPSYGKIPQADADAFDRGLTAAAVRSLRGDDVADPPSGGFGGKATTGTGVEGAGGASTGTGGATGDTPQGPVSGSGQGTGEAAKPADPKGQSAGADAKK